MLGNPVVNSIVYSFLGLAILVVSFILVDLLIPAKLWQEIVKKQNMALAILAGFFALAIGIIVASAIH